MDFQPIEDYAVVGNMRTMALVGLTGSIDFLCYPRFDSPTVFAALLDPEKGGRFLIEPLLDGGRGKQLYVPDTNVLVTQFLSEDGMGEVLDFMPILDEGLPHQIVRRVMAIRGEIEFRVECRPRFDYARMEHRAERMGNAVAFRPEGEGFPVVVLQASVPLTLHGNDVAGKFRLKEGEAAFFTFGEQHERSGEKLEVKALEEQCAGTSRFWQDWVKKGRIKGRWREIVVRSALVLKMMTDRRFGSIIAAPTFGLPEKIGGARNWDYRYTWLRDSSFTLYAMLRLGFTEEAVRFHEWLRGQLDYEAKDGPLQVMYGLDGKRDLPESELKHLRGYRDSKPVRIGNEAASQLQLDIYGESLDAVYLSSKYGDGIGIDQWNNMKRTLKWLSKHWQDADNGIWEVRGGRKKFLHSRLMCWVAVDRVIRLGDKRSMPGPFGWMETMRDEIADEIHRKFWNEKLGAFVQYEGSSTMDASVLLMPMMRFISPTDPRWLSTLAAVERELVVDVFVQRYSTTDSGGGETLDGMTGSEGSFNPCSFWYIEALARSHQLEKARVLFEKMLGYANHVGLYSEELGRSGEHLGNFPQALTHLALVSAATYLDRALSGGEPEVWR